ncbi:hypothetical protein SAMN02745124_04106 [Desulfofustis glycolicus DSM 9705]|uniref:Uncharacterized protein n=1 Tax=Desulfofustis glycolicus DSM 9705 TaxID=1121409 RepID=A0A1M5YJF2_9BACT|nr:hypothetical protein SAMN02745124_04106 [Desulfofustis glycolicus DSM 9705]
MIVKVIMWRTQTDRNIHFHKSLLHWIRLFNKSYLHFSYSLLLSEKLWAKNRMLLETYTRTLRNICRLHNTSKFSCQPKSKSSRVVS